MRLGSGLARVVARRSAGGDCVSVPEHWRPAHCAVQCAGVDGEKGGLVVRLLRSAGSGLAAGLRSGMVALEYLPGLLVALGVVRQLFDEVVEVAQRAAHGDWLDPDRPPCAVWPGCPQTRYLA